MSTLDQVTFDISEGLPLGKGDRSFTYLYGVSDFWSYLFEDFQAVNLMLETKSLSESEIYSRFLQISSGISIDQIQTLASSQIKLLIISDSMAVPGKLNTYKLPYKVQSSKYLANRVLVPTSTLESNVHYSIDGAAGTITFAQPLSNCGFPVRLLSDGTREYATWMVDVKIDEGWVYKYFAKLIKIPEPSNATEQFKSFVYGMYFLYCNGPDLGLFRRGLNLALGLPLARDTEIVLEIRQYLNTSDYLVVTDLNSYVIPYGIQPTVQVGDTLVANQELATWVELKDYRNDGDWWINLKIPATIMPVSSVPEYATVGSDADYLMRKYLKTHTFLVNVKTTNFKNIEHFSDLFSVIQEIKPKHTTPIYIWTVRIEDEIGLTEEMEITPDIRFEDSLNLDQLKFERDSTRPYRRGPATYFSRISLPGWVEEFIGTSKEISNLSLSFRDCPLEGFVTPQLQYRSLTDKEAGWVRCMTSRTYSQYVVKRDYARFNKRVPNAVAGVGYDPLVAAFPGKRIIFLYTTFAKEIVNKFSTLANDIVPEVPGYITSYKFTDSVFSTNFNLITTRQTDDNLVELAITGHGILTNQIYSADTRLGDFICTTYINQELVGVYIVTTNNLMRSAPYWEIKSNDPMSVKITGKLDMSPGTQTNPMKILSGVRPPLGHTTYSDSNNTNYPMDASGATFIEEKIWK